MNIQEIFDSYTQKMSRIYLYQIAMNNLAKSEIQAIAEHENIAKENHESLSPSSHALFFKSAKNNHPVIFARKTITAKERKIAVLLQKNKQYQWLLAEAYEAYEVFLKEAYAFAGYSDNDFWPLKDFGNITLRELEGQPFEWYCEQAKKKKDFPDSVINVFRKAFPEIERYEKNNALNVNLRFAATFIEHARHVIVHREGDVPDRDKFIDEVLKKAGLWNNGKPDDDHRDFIKLHFLGGHHERTLSLLEIKLSRLLDFERVVNKFRVLTGFLMAYAEIIKDSLEGFAEKRKT